MLLGFNGVALFAVFVTGHVRQVVAPLHSFEDASAIKNMDDESTVYLSTR